MSLPHSYCSSCFVVSGNVWVLFANHNWKGDQEVSTGSQYRSVSAFCSIPTSTSSISCLWLQVMLYDDEQGDCIIPEEVFERLEADLEIATAVMWICVSCEHSASTHDENYCGFVAAGDAV
eukprot:GHUV01056560.1.p1 GENE.GHUV01056560.1~~GHUV01056560.1.p1  ORF type:complete len:121 (-),score=21.40 GHUV01056560.1:137-499(-)